MKKVLLLAALLSPALAAASDYPTVFNISGTIAGINYTKMSLDITRHQRFLAANGVIQMDTGLASPLTGTCQFTNSGGVFCILQNGFVSYTLDLGANLSGTMRATDGVGNTFATVSVTFAGME